MKNPDRHALSRSPHRILQADVSRRRFLHAAGLTAGSLALGLRSLEGAAAQGRVKSLPKPHRSGIEHIVVVMMENRSFDHFLGWVPGADGRQAGLTYTDPAGVAHPTYPLAPDYQGCGHVDPDHSYEGGRIQFNNGACDGWLRAESDTYAIGYYTQGDFPFYSGAVPAWTTCDGYFSAIMAGTFPNRIYQYAAQTDRLTNSFELSELPTIFDRLADHSLRGRYYFSDVPFTALWGTRYLPISRPIEEFYADCAAGTLPEVSFVDPRFLGESLGLSNDDHPFADIRDGQVFLNSVYEAVVGSPNWANTVMVINYDEWGGFFDHVPPAVAPIPPADQALGSDGLRGFRVPAMVVAPWARRGFVPHDVYDHTSVLRLIEWRWHLEPLTVRDATARNLAEVLDFGQPNLTAPRFTVPPGPYGTLCLPGGIAGKWESLAEVAESIGFGLGL